MSTLVLAVLAGAAIGLAPSMLGGGGSVLAVPALIYLLGFAPVDATTASLVIVTLTATTALVGHALAGNVAWRTGLLLVVAGLVPAFLAGIAARNVPDDVLAGAFSVIAAVAALRMLRPARTPPSARARPVQATAAGAGLGALTGFLGVGGGFLAVPTLVSVLGLTMRTAVGTSLLIITANSSAALVARAGPSTGLDWTAVATVAGAAVLAAWDGKRLAAKVSGAVLQRAFAVVLLGVAAFMLVDALV